MQDPAQSSVSAATADDLQAFKRKVYDQLDKSGLVSTLKSQLRMKLIDTMMTQPDGRHVKRLSQAENQVAVLVCSFMSWHSLSSSLSVFDAEYGQANRISNAASAVEVLAALEFTADDVFAKQLTADYQRVQDAVSFPSVLLQHLLQLARKKHVRESGSQTTEAPAASLVDKLQALDAGFHNQASQPVQPPVAASDLSASAGAAQQQSRLELEQEWEQLQLWQQQQQSKLRVKEDALTARLKLQQREVERVAFEHRQTLLQEQARLLSWQAECQQAYQQQKNELEELGAAVARQQQAAADKEAAAQQQLLAAVQLVEQMQADCQSAIDQEHRQHRAELQQQAAHHEVNARRAASVLEQLEAKLEGAEQAVQAHRANAAAAERRVEEKAKLVARLEQALCDAQEQCARKEADMAVTCSTLQAAITEVQQNSAQQQARVQAAGAASDDTVRMAATMRHLQAESRVLQQEAQQYAKQLEACRLRVQQAEGFVDEALAGREAAVQRVEELTLATSQLEFENQHLKRALAALKHEVLATHLQSRPTSPSWDQFSGRTGLRTSQPSSPLASQQVQRHHVITPLKEAASAPTRHRGAEGGLTAPGSAASRSRRDELCRQEDTLREDLARFKQRIVFQRRQADAALTALRDRLSVPPASPAHLTDQASPRQPTAAWEPHSVPLGGGAPDGYGFSAAAPGAVCMLGAAAYRHQALQQAMQPSADACITSAAAVASTARHMAAQLAGAAPSTVDGSAPPQWDGWSGRFGVLPAPEPREVLAAAWEAKPAAEAPPPPSAPPASSAMRDAEAGSHPAASSTTSPASVVAQPPPPLFVPWVDTPSVQFPTAATPGDADAVMGAVATHSSSRQPSINSVSSRSSGSSSRSAASADGAQGARALPSHRNDSEAEGRQRSGAAATDETTPSGASLRAPREAQHYAPQEVLSHPTSTSSRSASPPDSPAPLGSEYSELALAGLPDSAGHVDTRHGDNGAAPPDSPLSSEGGEDSLLEVPSIGDGLPAVALGSVSQASSLQSSYLGRDDGDVAGGPADSDGLGEIRVPMGEDSGDSVF